MKNQGFDTTLLSLYEKGYNNFLCGVTAANGLKPMFSIILLRESCSDIEISVVISPSNRDKEICDTLFAPSDSFSITSDAYFDAAFGTPNDFLISGGGVVLSRNDKQEGATIYAFTEKDMRKLALMVQFNELNPNSPFNK